MILDWLNIIYTGNIIIIKVDLKEQHKCHKNIISELSAFYYSITNANIYILKNTITLNP